MYMVDVDHISVGWGIKYVCTIGLTLFQYWIHQKLPATPLGACAIPTDAWNIYTCLENPFLVCFILPLSHAGVLKLFRTYIFALLIWFTTLNGFMFDSLLSFLNGRKILRHQSPLGKVCEAKYFEGARTNNLNWIKKIKKVHLEYSYFLTYFKKFFF